MGEPETPSRPDHATAAHTWAQQFMARNDARHAARQPSVDVYPVGWLAALLAVRRSYGPRIPAHARAKVRRHAWGRVRRQARNFLRHLRAGHWHEIRNLCSGYVAEPREFPPGRYRRRCGTGWTKNRALRSLHRRLPPTQPPPPG